MAKSGSAESRRRKSLCLTRRIRVASIVRPSAASGVFVSRDSGTTWLHTSVGVYSPSGLEEIEAMALAVIDTTIFVGDGSSGVFSSSDTGNTWTNSGF